MGEWETQNGDITDDAGDRHEQLHQEDVDAVSVHPRLPDLDPWRTLKGSGEYARDVPACGKPPKHICPGPDGLDWEYPEV